MNESRETSLTEHQQRVLKHIRACEASGKRIIQYCAENGLSVRSMYDGRKVMVKKGILPRTHPGQFQRVKLSAPAVSNDWRIQLPNGVSVAFSGAVDAGALKQVLTTVAQLS